MLREAPAPGGGIPSAGRSPTPGHGCPTIPPTAEAPHRGRTGKRMENMILWRIYITAVAAMLGAVMGSFLNCWAQRYATGEKIPRGRSHCPDCGHVLSARELVPIFSWLFQRGRCRHCGKPIARRYLVTELMGAAAFGCAAWSFGFSLYTPEVLLLFGCLMLLGLIDYDTMILPNGPMIVAAVAWAVFLPAHEDIKSRAIGGLATAAAVAAVILVVVLIMDKVMGRETMGGGDIKLLALVGLYLGPWRTVLAVLAACLIGLIFALITRVGKKQIFPFGPAICIAAALAILWGDQIVSWYTNLFQI